MAPVVLRLRVHLRVTINLTGGRLKNPGFDPLGKTEHVDGAMHTGLGGLHRIVLIMDGTCRAGKVVNLVYFDIQGKADIVPVDFEIRVINKVNDITLCAGKKIINTNHVMAIFQKSLAEMPTQEACTAGYQYFFHNPDPYVA